IDSRESDIENNALIKHLKGGGHPEAAEYLFFSIQLEEYLQVDAWGEKEMDIKGIESSVKFAEEKIKSVKDEHIRLRYAYQLVVMNYYLNNMDQVAYYYLNHV